MRLNARVSAARDAEARVANMVLELPVYEPHVSLVADIALATCVQLTPSVVPDPTCV